MHWALLPLLVTAVSAAAVQEQEGEQTRDGKLFSIFQIVRFENDVCTTSDAKPGVCFTDAECRDGGGEAKGNCASGFGVCCHFNADTCKSGQTFKQPVTAITSKGFPNGINTADACATQNGRSVESRQAVETNSWIIGKYSEDVVQFRIDFKTLEIANPMMGKCENDTLVISGADPASTRSIPILCGTLTDQHIYVNVRTVDTFTLTINLAEEKDQRWEIHVTALDSTDALLAPRGCLQYYTNVTETLSTFNNDQGNGELINDQMYSICIEQKDDYCDVGLTVNNFDLGGSNGACEDSVAFGTSQYCGQTFTTNTWNYTGCYSIPVMSDSDNSGMNVGFEISYILLPC